MSDHSPQKTATKGDWKTLPLPDARAALEFAESYTCTEFDRIKSGLIPAAMEDKWFIFFEESWLYFHRSWTGMCVYAIRFEHSTSGATVAESWVSRDSSQYKETRTDYDRALLKFLIDALLLGEPAEFPVPANVTPSAPKGIYQHHLVGKAYPESTFASRPVPSRSLLLRITTFSKSIIRWVCH